MMMSQRVVIITIYCPTDEQVMQKWFWKWFHLVTLNFFEIILMFNNLKGTMWISIKIETIYVWHGFVKYCFSVVSAENSGRTFSCWSICRYRRIYNTVCCSSHLCSSAPCQSREVDGNAEQQPAFDSSGDSHYICRSTPDSGEASSTAVRNGSATHSIRLEPQPALPCCRCRQRMASVSSASSISRCNTCLSSSSTSSIVYAAIIASRWNTGSRPLIWCFWWWDIKCRYEIQKIN